MKQIGKTTQITKYIPLWFDETKSEPKANDFKDSNSKVIHFKTLPQAEKFLKGYTKTRAAIAKSVEHITMYF